MNQSIGAEKWSVEGTRSVIDKNIANLMATVHALGRSLSISNHGWGISGKPQAWDSTASSKDCNGELSAETGKKLSQKVYSRHVKSRRGVVPPLQIQGLFEGKRGPWKIFSKNVVQMWMQVTIFRWDLW